MSLKAELFFVHANAQKLRLPPGDQSAGFSSVWLFFTWLGKKAITYIDVG